MIDTHLLLRAQKTLEDRGALLPTLKPGRMGRASFEFEELRTVLTENGNLIGVLRTALQTDQIGKKRKKIAGPVIYRIQVESVDAAMKLKKKFGANRTLNSNGKARINDAHESRCIYVGSSKDIEARIRCHFSFSEGSTFGMRIGLWCGDTTGNLTVDMQQLPSGTDQESIQVIEDQVWLESCPVFGKKGGK